MKKQLLTITCTAFLAGLTCLSLKAQTLPKDECETVLNFDGTNDFIQLEKPSTFGNSSMTLETWVKVPIVGEGGLTSTTRVGNIFSNYDDGDNVNFEIHNNGDIRFYWNGAEVDTRGTTDLRDNKWHHIAFSRDVQNSLTTVYIDGEIEFSTGAGSNITFTSPHRIGADNRNGTGVYFHGDIAVIKVWGVAKTKEEIVEGMASKAATDPNLLHYYDFNDGKNSTVLTDYGTEKNHGTLTNMDPMVDWTKADGSEDTRSFSSNTIEKCGYYMWNGMKLTESGEYKHIIPNAAGCDSVMTLDLTINQIPDTAITMNGTELISNAENVEYKWYDCDLEEFVVDANAQSYIPEKNGSYAVLVSNDKCADTSACTSVLITDLDNEIFTNDFDLFPNPTSGTVKIVNSNPSDAFTVMVRDVIGVTVFSGSYTAATIDLNIEQSGVYLVNITSASGVKKDFRLVVQ